MKNKSMTMLSEIQRVHDTILAVKNGKDYA